MNFTFFSSAHGNFSRVDNILGHKSSLGKLKKNWNHFKHLIWSQCSKIRCQIQEHTHTHRTHSYMLIYKQKHTHTFSHTYGHPHLNMITHSNVNTFKPCTHINEIVHMYTLTCDDLYKSHVQSYAHIHIHMRKRLCVLSHTRTCYSPWICLQIH